MPSDIRRTLGLIDFCKFSFPFYLLALLLSITFLGEADAHTSYGPQRAGSAGQRPMHFDVGESLDNLGQLHANSKKNDSRAEPLFRRALEVIERLGPDYAGVAVPLSNLAAFYESKGDDAQAEQFYQRAVTLREKALGP
jgi:Tfp pilus assembly protein PilF